MRDLTLIKLHFKYIQLLNNNYVSINCNLKEYKFAQYDTNPTLCGFKEEI